MFRKLTGRSETTKNIATLVSGTAIAQAVALLVSPLLTRMYSPEDFALFALFSSIVAIIGVAATARYEMAIVLPKKEEKAENILSLSLLFSIAAGLLTFLVIVIYDIALPVTDKNVYFNNWFYLAPPAVFLTGAYAAFNYWSSRQKTFLNNSVGRVATVVVNSGISIVCGFLVYTSGGLILGLTAGLLIGFILLAYKKMLPFSSFTQKVSWKGMKEVMIEYKNFAVVNTPHAFLDSFQNNGVVFVLSYYFFAPIVGFYSLAFRMLKAPVGLIGSAFFQVTYQKMAAMKNEGKDVKPLILSVYKKVFIIGFPFFFVLFLFTPEIFSFVFGAQWKEAGDIAQIMTPWLFMNFLVSPVSCTPLVYGKQKQAFVLTIVDSVLRFASLVIGGIYEDYILAFYLMTFFCSALLIFTMLWYYFIPNNNNLQEEEMITFKR